MKLTPTQRERIMEVFYEITGCYDPDGVVTSGYFAHHDNFKCNVHHLEEFLRRANEILNGKEPK